MRAWHVDRPGPVGTDGGDRQPLVARDTPEPEPGPGELLLRVLACGVCRTDLHVAEGDLPVHRPGVTPGHEVVGEVVAAGPGDVAGFAVGDRAGAAWLRSTDGTCRYCTRGAENLCPASRYTGWDADGGYAEYLTVPAAYAHRLPAGYSDRRARPAAVRRHHRLPGAEARRVAAGRAAGAVRLRRQRAPGRAGRACPGRLGLRDDAGEAGTGAGAVARRRLRRRGR